MADQKHEIRDTTEARKLWIHCNCCYESYVMHKSILFLLACHHIICDKCVTASLGLTPSDAPTYMCPICRKKVRGRQVNNDLPTQLKDMFHPEPWKDGLQHEFITTFQRTNQKNFEKYIKKKQDEMIKLDKDIELACTICRKHYMKQQELRNKRKQMEIRARKIQVQAEIQKKKLRQRSVSPKSPVLDKYIVKDKISYKSKSVSRTKSLSAEPPNGAITSFMHHNIHSFIL